MEIFSLIIGIVGAILFLSGIRDLTKKRLLTEDLGHPYYGLGLYWPFKAIVGGIIFAVFGFLTIFPASPDVGNKLIGSIFFIAGLAFLVMSIAILVSSRTNAFFWRYITPGKDQKSDRHNLAMYFFAGALGLFFGFYVFYWG